jgi:hypothetical protein
MFGVKTQVKNSSTQEKPVRDLQRTLLALSEGEKIIISQLGDGEYVYPIYMVSNDCGIPLRSAGKILRGLRAKGICSFGTLLDHDSHRRTGSGYWLNSYGLEVQAALPKAVPNDNHSYDY